MTSEMDRLAAEMKSKADNEAEAKERLQQQVDNWPEQVQGLINTLDEWLAPLKESGLSTSIKNEHTREHEFSFDIPKYVIEYGTKKATTETTLFAIGCRGRVDLKGPQSTTLTMVMRETDNDRHVWQKMYKGNNRIETEALTQDHLVEFMRKAFKV
ncbi:hypothetical protein [Chromohalobacter sp. HP20-39]|uniref:hypothetical protein n=1 Tax=Chromohalobacter sp. HP20-39 TaxID=3079306 RepID=UPI00294B479E|nr:hypothetical protein [Chromohalobacter sp. HP20-39]MDV6318856.1 hypothetical protein [Chromohalobacter sp. HP20-39]